MNEVAKVLFDQKIIEERIQQMADEITRDYEGKSLLVIGILKGAVYFMTSLTQKISLPLMIDFMRVSSYGSGTESSGKPQITIGLTGDIKGKDVLLVDDIIDSGYTLKMLKQDFMDRGAASVRIAVLLDKKERRKTVVPVEYEGFEIPDAFVVGYGMDYAEQYRALPFIGVLKPEVYEK